MGCKPDHPAEVVENAGLYVLAARDIFSKLSQPQHRTLVLYVSCFEIYGGKLFDLLNDRGAVKCLEDAKQQVRRVCVCVCVCVRERPRGRCVCVGVCESVLWAAWR